MTSYTRQIAEFAAGLRLTDVPPEVVTRAKWLILDGLGCGLYGSDVRWAEILAEVVHRLEPQGGTATIWGRRETASAVNAALVNGTMVQGYELDDGHQSESFHSCAAVLPAAFAAAEYVGADRVSGERLLAAVIAGFEIGPRVSMCMRGPQMLLGGWHAPAIVSSFPAAVAAGIVLGLTSDQLYQALGIAGTQASGLMAAQFGSMVKRMQCAKNSQSGLYAALLAARGFTGIEDIFEQKYGGYCTTFSHSADQFDLPALVVKLNERWETMRAGIKIYACLGGNHCAVNAVELLMQEEGLHAANVDSITVGMTEAAVKHGGWHPYVPSGLTAAQMHVGFCIAVQLIEGEVFVDQMVEQNVGRPDLVDLANRIRAVRSAEREQKRDYDFRPSRGANVEVKLRDGRTLRKTVDFRPGSDQRPLTDEQILRKYHRLAGKVLSETKRKALADHVLALDSASEISSLLTRLRPD
jgi:2-methylcitrate dehydratase PrpD